MTATSEVVIVGGGISGAATAYELAVQGVKVTLLEKGDLANMASSWTLAGVRQSGRHPAELPLAKAAVDRWPTLGEELGADIEYRQHGNLRLARTEDEIPEIQKVVAATASAGITIEFLEGNDRVRAVAPALSESIPAASFCSTDGHANPTATVSAFAESAKRHGATIRTGVQVTGLATSGGRIAGVETTSGRVPADVVVVVAGIYTPTLLAPLGIDFPLQIVFTPAIQSVPMPRLIDQVLGVAGADLALRQQADGRIRATGGGQPWAGTLADIEHDFDAVQPPAYRIHDALERIIRVIPTFREARLAKVWGGLIDLTPDALPVFERLSSTEGLVFAAGFSGHGFGIGPSTGQILADLVMGGGCELPIDAFALDRFAGISGQERPTLHG